MAEHTVIQGEDINSIAFEYGFHPDTLWNAPENEDLKKKRRNPNILKEGDTLVIPAVTPNTVTVHSGKSHRFTYKGVTKSLKVQFDTSKANQSYIVKIKTKCEKPFGDLTSSIDENGGLIETIPPNSIAGEIILDPGENEETIPFQLGTINPVDDGFQGVQAMLNNMGFYCGDEDDELGVRTIAAIREFQQTVMGLDDNALLSEDAQKIDTDTLNAIEKEYINE